MTEMKKAHHGNYVIQVTRMVSGYVKNIFEGDDDAPLPNVPYSPLGGGADGAIEDSIRLIDEREAERKLR
ncbi:hypothetical protein ACVIHC_005872 [Bradyrhizobium diazoefficiens]